MRCINFHDSMIKERRATTDRGWIMTSNSAGADSYFCSLTYELALFALFWNAHLQRKQNTSVQLAFMHLFAACTHWYRGKNGKHQLRNHSLAHLIYTKDHCYEFSIRILACGECVWGEDTHCLQHQRAQLAEKGKAGICTFHPCLCNFTWL